VDVSIAPAARAPVNPKIIHASAMLPKVTSSARLKRTIIPVSNFDDRDVTEKF